MDPNNAIISFTSDDGVETKVTAKTVLVTVSLGVLKAGTIKFIPKLPRKKQNAIDNMGFAVMSKCVMQWHDKNTADIWPDELYFELMTRDDESSNKW